MQQKRRYKSIRYYKIFLKFCPLHSAMLHHGGDGVGEGVQVGTGSGSFPAFLPVREHESESHEGSFSSWFVEEICAPKIIYKILSHWAHTGISAVPKNWTWSPIRSKHSSFLWCQPRDYTLRAMFKRLEQFQPWRQTNSILDGGNCIKRIGFLWVKPNLKL